MRRVMVTMAAITFLTTSAYAQGRPGAKSAPPEPAKVTHEKRPQVDEKDYKAALDRIPNATEKPDPWGNVRAAPKAK
jgi:predicted small lipoprotein YifL